ncbi:hypothetical protein CBP51_14355 [Cellvibrio mixtus]|uniref:Uncharacterized protein n=1 Tax=Cellvibrio mixtus TaxID=39650 RepID=A0A266Q4V1_9GAMM|nr:hypothetical protein [Cellvibrio mixtus]OZY84389.1 hypothetical protein CBP51_14355 [Cellvibrio mixtus]
MSVEEYNENLGKAFEPNLSNAEAKQLLNWWLQYKSKANKNPSGIPPRAEEAIRHLQARVNNSAGSNMFSLITKHPIVSTFIGGLLVLIAWSFIAKYFGS